MKAEGSKPSHRTPFDRLALFVYRRRRYVLVAWILALVLLIPLLSSVGNYESLQQGSTVGVNLESAAADNLVSTQFQRSAANTTLIVVITGNNVSSLATQSFIRQIETNIRSDKSVVGVVNEVDVFSKLYAAIGGVNAGSLSAQSAATSFSGPFLQVWNQTYTATGNVTKADENAFSSIHGSLTSSAAREILALFYGSWVACPLPSGAVSCAASSVNQAAVGYVSESTGYSRQFVGAAFNLGKGYGNASLQALAGDIVWAPSAYHLNPGLSSLVSGFVSPGKDTTLVTVGLNHSADSNIVAIRSSVKSTFTSVSTSSGLLSAQVTGGDAISYDFSQSTTSDLSLILPVTIGLLIVATGLFFRSVLTPFITLGTIGLALGISQVFIIIVGILVAKADFTVPTILLTVLIGVGTDYSVFVIARYREERVKGQSVQGAVETSVTWAGESIATSGTTVIISFLSLAATTIVFTRTMGIVVGLGVLVALAAALTLVPAAIGMVGGRAFWPNSGARFTSYSERVLKKLAAKTGYFSRAGSFAVKRAKVLIIIAVLVSIPAIYVYTTTTPTFDFISAAPANLESISASNQLTQSFGAGALSPSYVVVTFSQPLISSHTFNPQEMATLESMSAYLAAAPNVANVTGPTRPYDAPLAYNSLNLANATDSRAFTSILDTIGKDNKTALLTIDFSRGFDPFSSQAISDAQNIRTYLHANFDTAPEVTGIFVGGAAGDTLDTRNVFDSNFNLIVPIVAVGVSLVLLVVLGSLFLPIFAVLSVLMSIVWTLAATKLVFQQFFNFQILYITPFFLFVTLLGLGMDYNVFILTRIREEAHKSTNLNNAIVGAIEQTGGIITAAAIILAGSLGSLMISSDLFLRQLGFAFAYSILIDALVVRTFLVPAVMSVMGKWNWYSPIPFFNRSKKLFEEYAAAKSHV